MSRLVHVAVGVVQDKSGNLLIAKRPDTSHQGGLWEFPGGKVECGESVFDALKRELQEELAIDVVATEPLIKIRHDYGDKVVLLDVHKVTQFLGSPRGNEGQPIQWIAPSALHDYEFPAANRPIITAMNLPQRLLITGEFAAPSECLARAELALKKGIRMLQLRVQKSDAIKLLAAPLAEMCNRYSASLVINTSPQCFAELAVATKLGLHLNSRELWRCDTRPVDAAILLGASCHSEADIKHAEHIGVDYICLSPVQATKSHPQQAGLGWDSFQNLVECATIPVYALGGMTEADLALAVEHGAQGIAAISAWW